MGSKGVWSPLRPQSSAARTSSALAGLKTWRRELQVLFSGGASPPPLVVSPNHRSHGGRVSNMLKKNNHWHTMFDVMCSFFFWVVAFPLTRAGLRGAMQQEQALQGKEGWQEEDVRRVSF